MVEIWVVKRNEERKGKGKGKQRETFFFFFFFLLPLLETFLQWENTKSAQYKGLPLKRGTLQSSLSWSFWLLWGRFLNFLSSVTMEDSRNWGAGLTASWDFYFSVFIFQGGVLGYQQEIDYTKSFSLRVLDRNPEPQWLFKELNGFPRASVSCKGGVCRLSCWSLWLKQALRKGKMQPPFVKSNSMHC